VKPVEDDAGSPQTSTVHGLRSATRHRSLLTIVVSHAILFSALAIAVALAVVEKSDAIIAAAILIASMTSSTVSIQGGGRRASNLDMLRKELRALRTSESEHHYRVATALGTHERRVEGISREVSSIAEELSGITRTTAALLSVATSAERDRISQALDARSRDALEDFLVSLLEPQHHGRSRWDKKVVGSPNSERDPDA
jgi:hypothetical protein